ncbi:hypothetical protein C5167_030132 [Papaver somniferum]|nr:hypothetical protein C5167_030132 [Papaver somniferum]
MVLYQFQQLQRHLLEHDCRGNDCRVQINNTVYKLCAFLLRCQGDRERLRTAAETKELIVISMHYKHMWGDQNQVLEIALQIGSTSEFIGLYSWRV